jgi:hypothetical protein
MSLIKLRLNRLSVSDKIQFGRPISQAMTGNPDFPTPTPSLAALADESNTLETAYNAAKATLHSCNGVRSRGRRSKRG